MKYNFFVAAFFLIITHPIMAFSATLKLEFPFQMNEPYTISYYTCSFLEAQPRLLASGKSDETGIAILTIDLGQPQILILSVTHGLFKIYCRPEDTFSIRIINARSISFSGDCAAENTAIFDLGLISDYLPRLDISREDPELILYDILSEYNQGMQYINEHTREWDPDFVRFISAEIIGRKYHKINNLKSLLIQKNQSSVSVDTGLEGIKTEHLIDENRSRLYNNMLSLYKTMIKDDDTYQLTQEYFWRLFPDTSYLKIFQVAHNFPKVRKVMLFSAVNALVFWAKDSLDLFNLSKFQQQLKVEYPGDYLLDIIDGEIAAKRKRYQLTSLPDFGATTVTGDSVRLFDFTDKNTVIYFWATWCKPCIAYLPSLDSIAQQHKDIQFLTVCIQDSNASWKKFLSDHPFPHLKMLQLNATESRAVFRDYSFDSVPNTVVIDQDKNILISGIGKLKNEDWDNVWRSIKE